MASVRSVTLMVDRTLSPAISGGAADQVCDDVARTASQNRETRDRNRISVRNIFLSMIQIEPRADLTARPSNRAVAIHSMKRQKSGLERCWVDLSPEIATLLRLSTNLAGLSNHRTGQPTQASASISTRASSTSPDTSTNRFAGRMSANVGPITAAISSQREMSVV